MAKPHLQKENISAYCWWERKIYSSFLSFFPPLFLILAYRVSINSFPDYKHLLQENISAYCWWERKISSFFLSFFPPLFLILTYRVSIKSLPDYKHLLQEKYVEYKHIFLLLLKLVSKILCHVFIVKSGISQQ